MSGDPSARLQKYDVFIDRAAPEQCWRIIDHWRDVYVLQAIEAPRRQRFVYSDELNDRARFRRQEAVAKAGPIAQD